MKVGRFFNEDEFCRSQTAVRKGISNKPSPEELACIMALVSHVLDPLRAKIGPITITSGFRSVRLNRAIGGSASSQHCLGQAVDIVVPGYTPAQVCQVIRDMKLPFDQLIEEFGEWTHVSFGPRNRREFLLARKKGGKTVYLKGD